jgi:hypothetical protein
MRERDEGSAPQVNDRVPYVAIVVPEKKNLLQGDRIEHPDYIIEKKLRVDYLFYLTNQIKNPTVQFLELLVEDPDAIFKEAIEIETNRRKGNITIDNHFKVKSIKKLTSLSLVDKAKKPKNFSKYYLNEDQIDIDKLGYEDDEQIEIDIDTESPDENFEKTKDKNKYKKLFLDLRI